MSNGIKVLCWAIGLCAAVFVLDVIAIVVVAVAVSDKSMQAAERGAAGLLGFEVIAALAATFVLWRVARELALWPRVFSVLGFLLPQAALFVAMGFFSLLALNR